MFWEFAPSTDASTQPLAALECQAFTTGSPPNRIPVECGLSLHFSSGMFPEFQNGVHFPLPYANITGGRIVSEDPHTGIRLEAFRIGYD